MLTRQAILRPHVLDAFVHLPLVLPPVVVGYVLLLLFGARGPIGGWLERVFGIELIFTRNGAALATAVMSFPLMVRAMRISLENVDRGLEDAARTLGAGAVDRFISITMPLMLPGVLAGAITAFSAALGEFGAVITFVSNIPGRNAHAAAGPIYGPARLPAAIARLRGWRFFPARSDWPGCCCRNGSRGVCGGCWAADAERLCKKRRGAFLLDAQFELPTPGSSPCSGDRAAARPRWSI